MAYGVDAPSLVIVMHVVGLIQRSFELPLFGDESGRIHCCI